ncbi:hypothetical protein, partial [Rubellimicrobium mesophilum]|uniref:hypothetical protein n=1 Tax=Rubellimicrobium mesophilum TaxID=1123067 RepID=UPI00056CAE94
MLTRDPVRHSDALTRPFAVLLPLLRHLRRLPLVLRIAAAVALVAATVAVETLVPALARYPLLAFVPASIMAGPPPGRG